MKTMVARGSRPRKGERIFARRTRPSPALEISGVEGSQPVSVTEEDLVALVARGTARRESPDLAFSDPASERLLAALDLDLLRFDARRARFALVRTLVIDSLARDFFARYPGGLGVSLLPGLCTRPARIDGGARRWLALEPEELSALKRESAGASSQHTTMECCSVRCDGWMRRLAVAEARPILLIAHGELRTASAETRTRFFTNAAQHLPRGSELVIDDDAGRSVRPAVPREDSPLAARDESGAWNTFPCIRFVPSALHDAALEEELARLHAVSRLFRGGTVHSVVHLRIV